jgi:predicted homoserine dehydrogenase-like protein
MYGPALAHVLESADYYRDKLRDGGMVDFLVGAEPGSGAFVIGHSEDSVRKDYLKYLKMGDGPLYVFHTPFHLPQLEIPNTVARAVLFRDATVMPSGAPVCDAVTIAKRDVKAGEVLDGLGGFTCYALLENYATSREIDALPMGVSDGCRLKCDVSRDQVLTYSNVTAGSSSTHAKKQRGARAGGL